jgi:signal transduction histidine kinase
MKPFRSLWVKLLAGFMLVAIVAVGLVAVLANRTTARQFEIYVSQGKQMRAQQLAPDLAAYYTQVGNWSGLDEWLARLQDTQAGGRGQGRGQGRLAATDRLIVADAEGRILADTQGELVGQRLSDTDLDQGIPIEANGKQIGTLLIPSAEGVHQAAEAEFLQKVNTALVWAGLAAGAVALILGLLLALQLTAPLRTLTKAAHSLEKGNLVQVQLNSQDEIGELGHAFNQMAESLARQKMLRQNLMADIAHELRTPLSVIRSDLEALLDGVYEPTPDTLASLQEETLLLSRLVNDLQALAQAEAGQLRLECQPTNLEDLLHGVIASFDLLAKSQGQKLLLELPPALPLIDADPQRIRQVIANLVSNALRHAPDSGCVLVSAELRAQEVQISVADNGPGITPEDLPHIFDRFWRGVQARAESSGLGLAIARELVRVHGGRIWVESEPGNGTVFHFTLPL